MRRYHRYTFDYAQLERDALNYLLMSDMVDGPMPHVIECTEYRDVTKKPLLLSPPEGQDVKLQPS